MFLYGRDDLAPGAFVGGWVVERLVARGSMSNVYAATGAAGLRAALKVLHQAHLHDRVALERFALEARALSTLRHPAVVRPLGHGELPSGLPWLALEWLDGTTLAERVAREGPLTLAQAGEVLEVLCSAVAATHSAGLVHRDLKAENVFCVAGGGVKLLDFGVARQLEDQGTSLTSTGHVIGTPIALAPEQIRQGPTSAMTDVYALGVLLHVMLAGRPPFEAEVVVDLEALHLRSTPPALSARARTPPALDAVAARCLEKKPEARYPDAAALWRAFQQALGSPADALAVGITVELLVPHDAPDAAWEQVERLERQAAAMLEQAGFAVPSDGVLVLGTRLDDGAPAAVEAKWRAFARSLKGDLGAAVPARVAVRVAKARVESGVLVESEVLRPLEWPDSATVG